MSALAEALVDLDAIATNVRTIASVTGTDLMAVVKADGFGHGAAQVARAAVRAGASWLGVTSTSEALALRDAGVTAPTLSWLHGPNDDFGKLINAGVDVGVSTTTHLHAVADAVHRLGVPAMVQLKADTGLSRNGAPGTTGPSWSVGLASTNGRVGSGCVGCGPTSWTPTSRALPSWTAR